MIISTGDNLVLVWWMDVGLCSAALQALRKQHRAVSTKTLAMLSTFLNSLSMTSRARALEELLAGDIVELTMGHLADAGPDQIQFGVESFEQFLGSALGRERLCAPGLVDQLMKWIAKWFAEVRVVF
jgi:hypothetical protein